MIDHISVAVSDLDASAHFYQAVLGAIGYQKLVVRPRTIGFGKSYPEFWLNLRSAPIAARMQRCACARANWSMRFTPQRLPRAAAATVRRACGRNTAKTITQPSFAIPMAIASRP